MLVNLRIILVSLVALLGCNIATAQKRKDTAVITPNSVIIGNTRTAAVKDTSIKYNPNKAIIRSAIIPGWGQITNKKIWKAPLVWAALGITGGVFFHNIRQYKDARNAYRLAVDTIPSNDYLIKQPYYSVKDQPERIRTFRNQVRQNVDYTVIFFLVFWGLNVADAAVDAHLKTFDVSDNLGLEIKPGHSSMANTDGLSLVLHLGK